VLKTRIIPIGIDGTYDSWRIPHGLPIDFISFFKTNYKYPIKIKFGKPYSLNEYYDLDLTKKSKKNYKLLHKLTDELMLEISKLSNLPYDKNLDLQKMPFLKYAKKYNIFHY